MQAPGTKHLSMIPFKFIYDIFREARVVPAAPSTYKYLLTESAFLQAAFNGILLTPLGIYNAPYRVFDVDDLLLNTLGGYIGYLISPVFTFFLPSREEIDCSIGSVKIKVTYFRRTVAYFIDMFLIGLIPKMLFL